MQGEFRRRLKGHSRLAGLFGVLALASALAGVEPAQASLVSYSAAGGSVTGLASDPAGAYSLTISPYSGSFTNSGNATYELGAFSFDAGSGSPSGLTVDLSVTEAITIGALTEPLTIPFTITIGAGTEKLQFQQNPISQYVYFYFQDELVEVNSVSFKPSTVNSGDTVTGTALIHIGVGPNTQPPSIRAQDPPDPLDPASVPEPSALSVLLAGLIGLGMIRRRRSA